MRNGRPSTGLPSLACSGRAGHWNSRQGLPLLSAHANRQEAGKAAETDIFDCASRKWRKDRPFCALFWVLTRRVPRSSDVRGRAGIQHFHPAELGRVDSTLASRCRGRLSDGSPTSESAERAAQRKTICRHTRVQGAGQWRRASSCTSALTHAPSIQNSAAPPCWRRCSPNESHFGPPSGLR